MLKKMTFTTTIKDQKDNVDFILKPRILNFKKLRSYEVKELRRMIIINYFIRTIGMRTGNVLTSVRRTSEAITS